MFSKPTRDRPELTALIAEAKARVERMTPAELEAMLAVQRAGYVRAEMSWPKTEHVLRMRPVATDWTGFGG